jgi:hypothetical protein
MQVDEEAKVLAKEEIKKMESQIKSLTDRVAELEGKLEEAGESNRIITQALRLKQEELNQLMIRHEALERMAKDFEKDTEQVTNAKVDLEYLEHGISHDSSADQDTSRFMLDSKPALGLVLLKGKKVSYREWLDKKDGIGFLKRAQKSPKCKEMLIERIGLLYSTLMIEEESRAKHESELRDREEKIGILNRKNAFLQDKMAVEEEAKRRTLLRYVHAVKAIANWDGEAPADRGVLQLPDSNVTDEEAHAVAALLKGNQTITELNMRANKITDEGARALAAVLSGRTALRSVDLRGNQITRTGVKVVAEAMERNERVRHVYVHAGGKVEALGTNSPEKSRKAGGAAAMPMVTVETVCVVDIRENVAPGKSAEDGAGGPQAYARGMPTSPPHQGKGAGQPGKGAAAGPSPYSMPPGPDHGKQRWGSPSRGAKTAEEQRRERLLEERRAHEAEARRQKKLEAGWEGRAGGVELRHPEAASSTKDLPSLSYQRSSTAPAAQASRSTSTVRSGSRKDIEQRIMTSPLLSPASGGAIHKGLG